MKWKCNCCEETFQSRRKLFKHKKEKQHLAQGRQKKTIIYCEFCNRKFTTIPGYKNHNKYCFLNPNKEVRKQKTHHWTDEEKKEISDRMKVLHQEGKAFSWADLSKRKEPSYPEKWLINVLNNNFCLKENRNYWREVKFHSFSLDFVFPNKKVIEIDGEQHQRSEYQKDCDRRKDALLKEEGWEELRIPSKNCYNHTQEYLLKIKEFIG